MITRTGLFLLSILALAAQPALAQALKPYDRLSNANVTLNAEIGTSGSQLQGTSTVGVSPTRAYETGKEIVVKIPVLKNSQGLVVEAFAVIKSYDSRGNGHLKKVEVKKISDQEYRFTVSAAKSIERVMLQQTVLDTDTGNRYNQTIDTGRSVSHGDKITGWFARAIQNNQIVGVCGSGPQMEELAGKPNPS